MVYEASLQDELSAVEYMLRTQLRSILTVVEQYITTNPEDLPEEKRVLLPLLALHLAYEQPSNRFELGGTGSFVHAAVTKRPASLSA